MPNVLDAEPLRVMARRAGRKIDERKVRERFERLAFELLLSDPRNFRLAADAEIDAGPDWAQRAVARGEAVSVCALHRGATQRVHALARQLAATCKLAAADASLRSHQAHLIIAARAFLARVDRANLEVTTQKARHFSRLWSELDDIGDFDSLCTAAIVEVTQRRVWRRVTSLAELRSVGREFRNCLARAHRDCPYGHALCSGAAQYWVLRDGDGGGLAAVKVSMPELGFFDEAKGPRNGSVSAYRLDIALLARAIGLDPDPPPSSPAGGAARTARPCRCVGCMPRAHDPPLLLDAAAP